MSDPVFTYQTRLVLDAAEASALHAYAELHGRAERALFAALSAGNPVNDLKRAFLPRFGLTARQFNALRVGLDGKIASIKGRRPDLIDEAKSRIKKAESVLAKLSDRAPGSNKLHQKKRRLSTLKARCAAMVADQAAGAVRLCFGSKRLFHAQFSLAANGYASHEDWKADWTRSRSSQFFVLGSGDEISGNQTCQATLEANGKLTLRLRLPDALVALGGNKTMDLTGVLFAYGHEQIVAALAGSRRIHTQTRDGKSTVKRIGTALSYRFVRDDKGWRVFVSVETRAVEQSTRKELGAIGIDVNADHLAVSEADRFGNLIDAQRIDLTLYGKTSDQTKALIGDVAVSIAAQAKAAGKPVVIEKLEFQKKKAELEAANPKQARLLSSLACRQVAAHLKAACYRSGVEVIEVNPAYTSVIGAVNHAQRHGISTHQGAALAIARRGLGFSERPLKRPAIVPVRNGGHVTFALPARNRAKHVWSYWASVRTKLKAAHAAHARSGEANAPPAPLAEEVSVQVNQNVLFLCSMNRLRSPSAQQVFSCVPGLAVRSAGLDDAAQRVCTLEDLQWADLVVVMEQAHRRQLGRRFGPALRGKKAIVLGIPDRYELLQPELVELLLAKVPQFLAVAVDVPAVRACLRLNPDTSGLPPLATSHCW